MLSFAHGAVQWSSADPAATDYVVSGLGFQPKALMFVTVGIQSATDAASEAVDQQQNLAFATSTSDRRVLHAYGMDNSATIRNQMAYRTDCIACTSTHTETDVNGRLDLSAIGSDGFTLTVDDQGVQDVTVLWFAWGGDDIANVETFEFAEPATATTVAVNLTGAFQPDVILVAGSAISGTAPVFDGGAPAGISLGFATPTDQIVVVMHSDDNAGSADADGYIRSGEIFAMVEESGAGMTLHASVQSFDADGVTFSFSEVSGVATRRAIGLAMRGGQWDVGGYVINATGAGNTATVSGLAFQPAGGLGFTRGTAENASDTSTGDGVMSVGAWSSTTSRRALGILDENGTGNAELNQVVEYDQYLAIPSAAGGLAEAYDISAVNSDGFQVIVDTANAGGSTTQLQGYLVFASAAGAGGAADLAAAGELGAEFGAVVTSRVALSAGVGLGASFGGQAVALAALQSGVAAASVHAGQASAIASVAAALKAGETQTVGGLISAALAAGIDADAQYTALAQAASAILVGLEAGEMWASLAASEAGLLAGIEAGAAFDGASEGALAVAMSAGTSAAAQFLGAVAAFGLMAAGALPQAALAAGAEAAAAIAAGVSAGAVFAVLSGGEGSVIAGAGLAASMTALMSAVATLSAGLDADAAFAGVAASLATVTAGVVLGATFSASSSADAIPVVHDVIRVVRTLRSIRVQRRNRVIRIH